MRHPARALIAAALLGALSGCPERADRYDEYLGLSGPALAGGRAVFLSTGRRAALVLEPNSANVAVVPLSGTPSLVLPRVGTAEVAVLCTASERLDVVDVVRGERLRTYQLGSPFDALTLSEDGLYAIATFAGKGGGVFANAAEVAIVSLADAPGATNPSTRTVASAGGAPAGIELSPPFGPKGRRIALIRSTNHLAAIDVTAPAGATRSIPLVSPGSGATVVPREAAFALNGDILEVFVRVEGLDDIYHLRFDGTSDADGAPLPVLNQFAVGGHPSDLATWVTSEGVLKLITVGGQSLTVVDVLTAQATVVPLGSGVAGLIIKGSSALAWPVGGTSSRFFRIALADLELKKSKAVEPKDLPYVIQDVKLVAGDAWYLVSHPNTEQGVTLVSATGNHIMPFTGTGTVSGVETSDDGAEIYVATNGPSGGHLSVINVATGHPESMSLGYTGVQNLYHFAGTPWLLTANLYGFGRLTLIRGSDIAFGASRSLEAFGLSGLLDETGTEVTP